MPNKPEEQNAPNMIIKGRNKEGMDWGPRSPAIYTSVTEGDPNFQQAPALGVHDDEEVELMISHTDGQIVIDIIDDRYKGRMLLIEKRGGKLQMSVWADADYGGDSGVFFPSSPYLIDFNETEPKEAK